VSGVSVYGGNFKRVDITVEISEKLSGGCVSIGLQPYYFLCPKTLSLRAFGKCEVSIERSHSAVIE
jgi:hypothetical protein